MSASTHPVAGKVVLITGAARGIGADSARRLAARGARLALVGLEPAELERVRSDCGPEAIAVEADVTDPEALERAVTETVERLGGIDVVVANAGVGSGGTVRTIDPAAFERTIEVNLLGVWRTVRACLPHVIERRGYVLCVASLAAALHSPTMGAYAASKAGVEAFADSLRQEVAHLGVQVGVGYFSFIDTDMVSGARANPATDQAIGRLPRFFAKTHPLSDAGHAVLEGVERRARVITAPRWVRAVLLARGWLQPLGERTNASTAQEIVQLAEADVDRRGAAEASRAVGAGGAADAEAAGRRDQAPLARA